MADGPFDQERDELTPRDPSLEDLVDLCRELISVGADFLVVGGFAMRAAGYPRHTGDVDLLVNADPANEALVFKALEFLPDQAVKQLDPGDISKFRVVRVADEILVDLMASAAGITYAVAIESVVVHKIGGVPIPFASPELLWRMKCHTHREKDAPDLHFLRKWFEARGRHPPD